MKNRRGKGNRGGKGFAGSKKHRKSFIITYMPGHIGSRGFTPLTREKNAINLRDISLMVEKGMLQKDGDTYVFEFHGKILGKGDIDVPLRARAISFSQSAKTKIENAGGEVRLLKPISPDGDT
ncbi:MAG: uL15m family ribosomal protein [Candidatus Micrarchaeia archaeon]